MTETDNLLIAIGDAAQPDRAIEIAREDAVERGAIATTMHIAAPHASQVGPAVFIANYSYDDDWRRDYYNPAIRQHDPFPDYVMRKGETVRLSEALPRMTLTPEQGAFVDKYWSALIPGTFAIPVYGPFDFDTYATCTMGRPLTPEDDDLIEHVVAVVEAVNRRIARLIHPGDGTTVTLSGRETEVLQWIGRSKSNGDIATILNVSTGTVDTYVRRLYQKLEVNDRIAAAVKGVRLGLIRY